MRRRQPPFDSHAARRELQLSSIVDIQGSIHANDTKSSAGLVVHGLLFAGVLSVLARLGDSYSVARPGAKIVGIGLLLAAAIAFVVSVYFLIQGAKPHNPVEMREKVRRHHPEAFFPPPGRTETPFEDQLRRLRQLNSASSFEHEYAAEQVKLADIRATEAKNALRGFRWLTYELVAVVSFLLLVGLVAIQVPLVTHGRAIRDPSLGWQVFQAGQNQRASSGGIVQVHANQPVRIRARASGDRVARIEVVGTVTSTCGGSSATPSVIPISIDRQRPDSSDDPLVAEHLLAPQECAGESRPRAQATLLGRATGGGRAAQGQLTVEMSG